MDILQSMTTKELSLKYFIPYRTIQGWKNGTRKPPSYIQYMIKTIEDLEEENNSLRIEVDYLKYKAGRI